VTRLGFTLLFSCWLALGVGGKILRYGPEREQAAPRTERLVRSLLESQGWRFVDRRPITKAGLYAAQSFTKPGCARPLEVAVIGASNEAFEVVMASLGPDAAVLDDGRITARPSGVDFAARAMRGGLSFTSDRLLLPMVVSPAPAADDHSWCASPAPAQWAGAGAE
jgi:hypothetical protein